MDKTSISPVEDRDAMLVRPLEASSGIWILQVALCQDALQLQDELGGQPAAHIAHKLKGAVIIEDHSLTAIGGRSPRAQQLQSAPSRGRRALKLTRTDGLLHQRADEIALARL